MSDWEALCKRCGQCCFEKWVDEAGVIHPTAVACRFLDIVTRECKVYGKRFEVGEGCIKLTPEVVETVQWLPPDCGYRRRQSAPQQAEQETPRRGKRERSQHNNPKRRNR